MWTRAGYLDWRPALTRRVASPVRRGWKENVRADGQLASHLSCVGGWPRSTPTNLVHSPTRPTCSAAQEEERARSAAAASSSTGGSSGGGGGVMSMEEYNRCVKWQHSIWEKTQWHSMHGLSERAAHRRLSSSHRLSTGGR